ncbi:hypothetical protein M569_02321, partial [Genlisea aurea]
MGEHEVVEPVGLSPNGLLLGAGSVIRALDADRWLRAEERTNELISCIQPNRFSEKRRNAVAHYVQQRIMKCFPCQVFTFGSVPLKTYLPDGDIDLTVVSHDQNLKDTWANQVRDMLANEEKNENAEFNVKEIQYIQADVKIIKCLVENIVVDISFNQIGGLCTLCFLLEVDHLIGQNHLFKRSIILIKAWCYYESRILGAHHGLISTYALETLVLYIFHVFNNSFHGPLEVLYRFLEFFSNFDWDHFCVSLWGPVPISSLPDVTAEPPRKDSADLLLSKLFLDACSSVYAVFPGGLETNGQNFVSKHFNVIDPLRVSNNLGRSVSKGNFYRIRSAFAFGAKRLARLLDCSKENLLVEVNQFFWNTWERHGSGRRPDAASEANSEFIRLQTPDASQQSRGSNNDSVRKNVNETVEERRIQRNLGDISAGMIPKADSATVSYMQSLRSQKLKSSWRSDKVGRENSSDHVLRNDETQKDNKVNYSVNESQERFLFARTCSSPELTDGSADISTSVHTNRQMENHGPSPRQAAVNRRKNIGSVENALSLKPVDGNAAESSVVSNAYHRETGLDPLNEISPPEEQDIVNMMASASLQGSNSQLRVPFGLSSHLPFSVPPTFLAPTGYSQRNLPGFVPTNVQYGHDFSSHHLAHLFPGVGVSLPSEANFSSSESKAVDVDDDFWQEEAVSSPRGYESENGNFDVLGSGHKPESSPVSSLKYIPPPRKSGLSSGTRSQQRNTRGSRSSLALSNDYASNAADRNSEHYAEERSQSSRFSSATRSNSVRSRTSSESSWDGASQKTPKFAKEKKPKKVPSEDQAPVIFGKEKVVMPDHMSDHAEADEQEWVSSSSMGETVDISTRAETDTSSVQQIHNQHIPSGLDVAQTSGVDSVLPFAPMLIGPGSRQKVGENSGMVAFYPTGPPIPFLTMLPVYNIPDASNSDSSGSHLLGDENSEANGSMQDFSTERSNEAEVAISHSSSSLRGRAGISEASETKMADILNSDFASHWQNLQFGRFCQNPFYQGPVLYPSQVMVPPVYLPGRGGVPYDNAGRPVSTNMNLMSHLMANYGQHLVPIAPLQPVSSRSPNIYQPFADDMPRFRTGTGTYFPNPAAVREHHSTGSRRGSYRDERNDSYGDRDGSWNSNARSRAGLRSHNR